VRAAPARCVAGQLHRERARDRPQRDLADQVEENAVAGDQPEAERERTVSHQQALFPAHAAS
jgi:hypothetical protein